MHREQTLKRQIREAFEQLQSLKDSMRDETMPVGHRWPLEQRIEQLEIRIAHYQNDLRTLHNRKEAIEDPPARNKDVLSEAELKLFFEANQLRYEIDELQIGDNRLNITIYNSMPSDCNEVSLRFSSGLGLILRSGRLIHFSKLAGGQIGRGEVVINVRRPPRAIIYLECNWLQGTDHHFQECNVSCPVRD